MGYWVNLSINEITSTQCLWAHWKNAPCLSPPKNIYINLLSRSLHYAILLLSTIAFIFLITDSSSCWMSPQVTVDKQACYKQRPGQTRVHPESERIMLCCPSTIPEIVNQKSLRPAISADYFWWNGLNWVTASMVYIFCFNVVNST